MLKKRSLAELDGQSKLKLLAEAKEGEGGDEGLSGLHYFQHSKSPNGIATSFENALVSIKMLRIECRYDVFHDQYLVEGPLLKSGGSIDQKVLVVRSKIHKAFRFDPGTGNTFDAIMQLCLDNKFDPILDYLDALTWDGTPRLDRWLVTYAGAEDTELNREFGRIALVAAVRRARQPGIKFDPIIVLEGSMGTNKSKAIETLAGVENFRVASAKISPAVASSSPRRTTINT